VASGSGGRTRGYLRPTLAGQIRDIPGPVLVTGGAGFIGSNLVRALLRQRVVVRVLDNLEFGTGSQLDGLEVELIQADVRDREAVRGAVGGCGSIVHLAAVASVLESVANPWPTFDVNASGTLRLLEAAAEAGVSKFVFASSSAALGEHEPPLDEDKLPQPVSPYGASKLAAEGYCGAYRGSRGLNTTVLRFSNVYGPFSTHKTSVVSKLFGRILRGESVTVYGDGEQTRDFVHVEDVVEAIELALCADVPGSTFQIATGRETSIRDLLLHMRDVTGVDFPVERLPQPDGEIRRNVSSIDRARRLLGYEPRWDLRTGLVQTYTWLSERIVTIS
jgi:UDP-glucose 4-epimerase